MTEGLTPPPALVAESGSSGLAGLAPSGFLMRLRAYLKVPSAGMLGNCCPWPVTTSVTTFVAKFRRQSPDFVASRGADNQWYLSFRGRNGQKVMTSEGYTRAYSARRAANDLVRRISLEKQEIVWHPESPTVWLGLLRRA